MMDTITGDKLPVSKSIFLGERNFIGSLVSIMPGTRTPNYCTVSIHSLLNKDYTALGQNVLIGGIPAKLLRQNISRDWESEEKMFNYLKKVY
jgi:acetyltransferase-like isoleucine patch superfamily enzyme